MVDPADDTARRLDWPGVIQMAVLHVCECRSRCTLDLAALNSRAMSDADVMLTFGEVLEI